MTIQMIEQYFHDVLLFFHSIKSIEFDNLLFTLNVESFRVVQLAKKGPKTTLFETFGQLRLKFHGRSC